ncbi:MAG: hypothetical protein WC223_12555 [Bacteroidales bacterium]|jgi:hypothetical protein
MKENILSILIGALISFFMSFTGGEIIRVLIFSFLGGVMGFMGNRASKYLIDKIWVFVKKLFSKIKALKK